MQAPTRVEAAGLDFPVADHHVVSPAELTLVTWPTVTLETNRN